MTSAPHTPLESPSATVAPLASSLNRLKELVHSERPQERLQRLGPGALSDVELLAMLLRSGTKGLDVVSLASQLLSKAGSLCNLVGWTAADFKKLKGIGSVKALQLVTVMEVARRVAIQQTGETPIISQPDQVASFFRPIAAGLNVEKFWVLCLNRKNRLIKHVEISSGTATSALAHPREIFREAIREGAVAIICVHNHPSGDPQPSAADIQITRQIREAAKVIGMDFLDHIIVGEPKADPAGIGFYSFKTAGII